MSSNVGDRIIVESEKVGVPTREGEILEVIPHETRPEFRVRWEDSHVSEIRPVPGTYRIESTAKRTRA
ncbi:MAG: DUF1918 domain-containing protein [Candidatus Limnocylindrales bacterium]